MKRLLPLIFVASSFVSFSNLPVFSQPVVKPANNNCEILGNLAANSPDCQDYAKKKGIQPKVSSTPDWVNVATLTSGSQLNVDKRSILKNRDKSVEGSFAIIYRDRIFLKNYDRAAFSEVFRVRADCQYGRLYNTKPVPYDREGKDVEVPQVIQDIRKIYPEAPNAPSKFLTPIGLERLNFQIKELEQERASFKLSSMSDSINNFLFKGLCK